jgi:hypothetical protein
MHSWPMAAQNHSLDFRSPAFGFHRLWRAAALAEGSVLFSDVIAERPASVCEVLYGCNSLLDYCRLGVVGYEAW